MRKYFGMNRLFIAVTYFVLVPVILFNSCTHGKDGHYLPTGDSVRDGEHIARIHCSRCHAFVRAEDLSRDVWKYHALPSMSKYAGITSYLGGYYKNKADTSGISFNEWQYVLSYFLNKSPQKLSQSPKPVSLIKDWAGFKLKIPANSNEACYTTMVKIMEESHSVLSCINPQLSSPIYRESMLIQWDGNLNKQAYHVLPSPASDVFVSTAGSQLFVSCEGKIVPVDTHTGSLIRLPVKAGIADKKNWGTPFSENVIDSGLDRPVQVISGDFNHDGNEDLVLGEAGNLNGSLTLYTKNRDSSFKKSSISDHAGTVQIISGDFNGDGWLDLMVLYGIGDEGLWLYTNDKRGGFTQKNVLRFPPVYGSTSFQLVDLDGDGKLDLVYTCGYNFRDSRILKPYHGLYLFKNIGNWIFKQQWFYPINGCTKAIAANFKSKLHQDIACSAFFADMQNHPEEEFLYFSFLSPFRYQPHSLPISGYGRWLTMSVGDLNGDGRPDIILGNYSTGFLFQPGFNPPWRKNLPFVLLQNKLD